MQGIAEKAGKMNRTSNLDKAVSIFSYITMGTAGLLWIIAAYIWKKKPGFFLMYNIIQSMLISVCLALFHLALTIILQILALIPVLNIIGAFLNRLFFGKIIIFSLSLNLTEMIVFTLIIYVSAGILMSRIFFIPAVTKAMGVIMRNYR